MFMKAGSNFKHDVDYCEKKYWIILGTDKNVMLLMREHKHKRKKLVTKWKCFVYKTSIILAYNAAKNVFTT